MIRRLQSETARAAGVNAVVGGLGDTGTAKTPSFDCGGLFQPPEAPGIGVEPSPGMPPHNIRG